MKRENGKKSPTPAYVHKLKKVFILCLLLLSIPLTEYIVQQQQELRQQAQVTPHFHLVGESVQVLPGQTLPVGIAVDTQRIAIQSVQVNLVYPHDKLVVDTIDTNDSAFSLTNENITGNGLIRIGRESLTPTSGMLHVAQVVFIAKEPTTLDEIKLLSNSVILDAESGKNVFAGLDFTAATTSAGLHEKTPSGSLWKSILDINKALWNFVFGRFGFH